MEDAIWSFKVQDHVFYNQERSTTVGVCILWTNPTRSGTSPLSGSKMIWSPHIETVTSRANKVLGLIKQNLWNCATSVKVTVYTTLVRPKLPYACSTWDPQYQKDKATLERVQQKAAACSVHGNCDRTMSMTGMLQDLQWDTLETMKRKARLSTIIQDAPQPPT